MAKTLFNENMKNDLYFRIDNGLIFDLLNKQSEEMRIVLQIYLYEGETNHPTDLARQHYYKYLYSVEIKECGNRPFKQAILGDEQIIATCADYRVMHKTVDENIEMIRQKMGMSYLRTVE